GFSNALFFALPIGEWGRAQSRARPCKRLLLQIPPGGLAAVFSRSPRLAVRRRRRRAAGPESFHRAAVGRREISADTTAQGKAKTDWRQCRKILCPNCRSPRVRRAARSAQLPLHDSVSAPPHVRRRFLQR